MIYKSVLVDRHFGFDAEKQQWYDGRRAVDSEAPLTFLIRAFKSCGVPDAGLKAQQALSDAESSPELTFASFKKLHLRRDYSARVKGIDVFLMWAKTVGIEVDMENLVHWCRKHPFILHRFYEAAARAGIRIKNCARVWGLKGVFRHVFVGFKLVVGRADRGGDRRDLCNDTQHDISGPTVVHGSVLPRVSGT